jgi:predicted nuclease of predicted toxin-antitoxin system
MPSTPSSAPAWRFLVDENLPVFLADRPRAAGHHAAHVYDAGLRGVKDPSVFAYAQANRLTIITGDKDFAALRRFGPPHVGIVVAEAPDTLTVGRRMDVILDGLATLAGQSLDDTLVIIEPQRVRVRR